MYLSFSSAAAIILLSFIFLIRRKRTLTLFEKSVGVMALILGVIGVLPVVLGDEAVKSWRNVISDVAIVAIIISLLFIFRMYILGDHVKKLGKPCTVYNKVQYYLSRDDLPFEELVHLAKKEIIFVSITHEKISSDERDIIRDAIINRNVTIKIIVLNPTTNLLYQEGLFGVPLRKPIEDSIQRLCNIKHGLKEHNGKLIIQTYNNFDFPYSLVIIDHTTENGSINKNAFIKIEEHPPLSKPHTRMNKAVFYNDNPRYYNDFFQSYDGLSINSTQPCT